LERVKMKNVINLFILSTLSRLYIFIWQFIENLEVVVKNTFGITMNIYLNKSNYRLKYKNVFIM
ncbi:hypothetical protein, partial [Halarcobacter sp.]|uniref:hypothetical protein n=1 Tax=Halarcobacter sp. TaxID=2321133 RepID=UPI003A8F767B